MHSLVLRNRWTRSATWLASLAILLAALAPTVSRWLAAAQGRHAVRWPTMEVCVSRPGAPSILVLKRAPDQAPPAHAKLDHCPLCTLQADGLALPPAAAVAPQVGRLGDALPWLFLASPRPLHAWRTAQARAPPAAFA